MEIRMLGQLSARTERASFAPTAGKPRQILAMLAMCPNQVVPVGTLMDELWGTRVTRSSQTTLQTYIVQLRRLLAEALGDGAQDPKDVLVTRQGGYLLQVPRSAVDVQVFEDLAAQGRAAFGRGDNARAAELLGRAVGMWRGPALVDVPRGAALEIEEMRLAESRLGTLELRIDADLRLGREAELITELTALTARHPLHEGLHSQAMVALYRCGRQAQAIEVYRALRARLVGELGVEPSARMQRLHQSVLCADPALDSPLGHGPTPTPRLYAA
ncbi:AfsR/SARP family transcriptional regulator [Streptomyces sp. NBC_00441]|uniref:AfsR/SARP family transcriptional regulator n=1 Tax=Streptomyces sp. NBC_00441 TaxID=2975742 RepID=UPI002E2C3E8D|nr:AfsR/SARP family transcriptional regulator [Streptomyces sp. NBC_00441]